MGQEASCCGNTTKVTRGGGRVTYDGNKKRHVVQKDQKKRKYNQDAESDDLNTYESGSSKQTVAMDDFSLLKVIGRGSYGKVYLVNHNATNVVYAMKSIKKELVIKTDQIAGTKAEREILQKLDHPFIMKLQFAFQDTNHLYLVMDFVNGGELFYHLNQAGRFPEERARFYCAEMVLAIQYLHETGIVYRDLKPENILIDNEGHVKLTDFGLSKDGLKKQNNRTESFVGTTEYLAPEIIKEKSYGYSVDWYSMGLVTYEMMCGNNPFKTGDTLSFVDQMNLILTMEFKMPKYFSEAAKDFLNHILQKDPKERIGCGPEGAEEIKRHPWFKGIDWAKLYEKQVAPPFVPVTQSTRDTNNVDEEFLQEAPQETPVQENALMRVHNKADLFDNFSYVNETNLPTQMSTDMESKRKQSFDIDVQPDL